MRVNQYAKFLGVLVPGIAGIGTELATNQPITHGTTPVEIGIWVVAIALVYVLPNARSLAEQASQVFTEVHHHHYKDAIAGVNAIGREISNDVEAASGKHQAAPSTIAFESGHALGQDLAEQIAAKAEEALAAHLGAKNG